MEDNISIKMPYIETTRTDGSDWNELHDYYLKTKRQKHGYTNEETSSYLNKDNEVIDDDEFQRLDQPLIRNVEQIKPVDDSQVIKDETTLATIALTLHAFELNQTLVHMYTLATNAITATNNKSNEITALYQDFYFATLRLHMDPKYDTHFNSSLLLEKMQSSTMVLARSDMKYFMWTAVTAIWRYKHFREGENDKMKLMLPRLAESLAKRVVTDHTSATVDDWKIYLQTLKVQTRYIDAINELLDYKPPSQQQQQSTTLAIPYMTQKTRLETLASLALEMSDNERGFQWYQELYRKSMNDWTLGCQMLKCAYQLDHLIQSTSDQYMNQTLQIFKEFQDTSNSKKKDRGPYLLNLECIAMRLKSTEQINQSHDCNDLHQQIIDYVTLFAGSVSCCFIDIRPYLSLLLENINDKETFVLSLLNTFQDIRENNKLYDEDSIDLSISESTKKLRTFIVACQIGLEVWSKANQCFQINAPIELLPTVNCMMRQYESSFRLHKEINEDLNQKEVLPGDNLILLSSFRILLHHSELSSDPILLIKAIAILEHGLSFSPHNPQILLLLVSLYASPQILNASFRVFDLFQLLDVKQIQMDSLSYLFLPSALSSGLYKEATDLCVRILDTHKSTAATLPDHTKKSMINGFYIVAEDMMNFQRLKMHKSVQLLEAKAMIMDLAPLYYSRQDEKHCLGALHGLTGGTNDKSRALLLVDDASDFFGAPSIIKIVANDLKNVEMEYEDNRDFSLWNFVIGCKNFYGTKSHQNTSKVMTKNSFICGHIHAILVRAVLITCSTKPHKKKKKKGTTVIVVPEIMKQRCKSLTNAVKKGEILMNHEGGFWKLVKGLTLVITSICANDPPMTGNTMDSSCNSITNCLSNVLTGLALLQKEWNTSVSLISSRKNDMSSTATMLSIVCSLLPKQIVPAFTLIITVKKVFKIHGWTKNKNQTKKEATQFLSLISEFKLFLVEMKKNLVCSENNDVLVLENIMSSLSLSKDYQDIDFLNSTVGNDSIENVIKHVLQSHENSKQRILPFFNHMIDILHDYEVDKTEK